MPELYPAFEVPEELVEEEVSASNNPRDVETIFFDFNNGDIKISNGGQLFKIANLDAYVQWALKCILTERYNHIAYTSDFGVEIEPIIQADLSRKLTESEIRRTITEALMVNYRTISVENFKFSWKGDSVNVEFEVETIYGRATLLAQFGGE